MPRLSMPALEQAIGVAPRTSVLFVEVERLAAPGSMTRNHLNQWLEVNGIPRESASKALPLSVAKAYCEAKYLASWRARVNPNFRGLLDNVFDGLDAKPEAKPDPRASDAAPAPIDDATLKALVQTTVNETVAKARLQLDDGAKSQIRALVLSVAEETVKRLMPPQTLEIKRPDGNVINVGVQHVEFPRLLKACQARDHKGNRLNLWLSGPTGSGKTSAAEGVAKALGLPFACDGSLDADYKVVGFRDANGNVVRTEFWRIFVNGGVYVADEIDNWNASALLTLNAALANGFATFPDGLVQRHPDCIIIACANTWGLGATGDYVGRTRLDAASLDRFQPKIEWPIDEKLERSIAQQMGGPQGLQWFEVVRATRQRARSQGLKIIISPRATFAGISQLQAGFILREVIAQTLHAGLSPEQIRALGDDSRLHAVGDDK